MRVVRRTPKIAPDQTLKQFAATLTNDERELIVIVLQRFSGGGPYPSMNNLDYWRTHYVLACVKKAFRAVKPEHRERLRALEAKIIKEARRAR